MSETCQWCGSSTIEPHLVGCQHEEIRHLRAQLAAVTAERDEAKADVKRLEGAFDAAIRERDEVLPYREYLTAATERAEKAEAERDTSKALLEMANSHHNACMRDAYELLGIDASDGEIRYKWVGLEIAKLKDRAVAHWAECEAWRAVASKMRREGKWINEPIEAREASDRARNPILEPPTQGGENPGAV